jgi:hypothetical protein
VHSQGYALQSAKHNKLNAGLSEATDEDKDT